VLTAAITLLGNKIGSQSATFFATVSTLPVHVAAHRIYQDAREAGRLKQANPVPHPSFMPTELIAPALT
jgi:prophage DNA circulation protein